MSSSRQRSSKQRSSRSRDRDSRDRDDRRRSGERGDHNRRSDRDRESNSRRSSNGESRRRETQTRSESSRRSNNNEATTPIHFNSSSPPQNQQYRQHSNPNSPNSTATDNTSNISNQQTSTNKQQITDSEVQLDIPMADLMAYLQVVANNSSNLPLTRRDDIELGNNIVSSLSEKEYEYKCNAFIPSNVRIIGGVFGRYGNVWDLPTSEEFDIISSTREPGISHGGSCCNALLKAMYDTESEVNNIASPHNVDASNLFDDDDDETVDTAGYTVDRTLASFDTLVLNDSNNASSMSWTQLLRKMKPEMQGVGFNQVPAVTSSYQFDLNEPFGLVPPGFQKGVNKKRALLIGCNYRKTPDAELKACHDDVRSMKDFLVNVYGFPETSDAMTILMDDKKHKQPTHANITNAFKQLAEKCKPGDAVFVLFTGHGCRVLDSPIDETAESYDEAIIPTDYEETGIIRDTLFFKTLLAPMKKGVNVTCIIDCSHTGVMIDLPYMWSTKGDKGEPIAKMSLNNDFSFVRFLKVVKTLYESSVFTKIGKTVGSELDKQLPARDDETAIETIESEENVPEAPVAQKTFFDRLCSNAFLNCGLQAPEEYSDDEEATLGRSNTMDDDDESYDS